MKLADLENHLAAIAKEGAALQLSMEAGISETADKLHDPPDFVYKRHTVRVLYHWGAFYQKCISLLAHIEPAPHQSGRDLPITNHVQSLVQEKIEARYRELLEWLNKNTEP